MIHFCFTVNDIDAANIIGCINHAITDAERMYSRAWSTGTDNEVALYYKHKQYLTELKGKMTNLRVVDVNTEDTKD